MSTRNLEKSFEAAQAASARLERRVLKGCLKMLKSVPDPRIDRQKKHRLSDVLAIAVLTYVSGGDGYRDMERYGRKPATWSATAGSTRRAWGSSWS